MHQRPAGAKVSLFDSAKAGIASIFKAKTASAEAKLHYTVAPVHERHAFRWGCSRVQHHRKHLRSIQRLARRKERKIRVYGYSW